MTKENETMEAHKAKPVRKWRDLLVEIGVIVLSVCIALAAEQIVDAFRWKHKVAEAEDFMRKELGDDDGPQAAERLRISRCIDAQLDETQVALLASRDQGAPFKAVKLTVPAFYSWDADAWRAAVASDVSTHMETHRMYDWTSPYALIPDMGQTALREAGNWASLRVIETAPAHPSPQQISDFLQLIAEARGANALLRSLSENFLRYVASAGVELTKAQRTQFLPRDRAHWPACSFAS
jgi:hypothetical protein